MKSIDCLFDLSNKDFLTSYRLVYLEQRKRKSMPLYILLGLAAILFIVLARKDKPDAMFTSFYFTFFYCALFFIVIIYLTPRGMMHRFTKNITKKNRMIQKINFIFTPDCIQISKKNSSEVSSEFSYKDITKITWLKNGFCIYVKNSTTMIKSKYLFPSASFKEKEYAILSERLKKEIVH